jgi:hypothetical protein
MKPEIKRIGCVVIVLMASGCQSLLDASDSARGNLRQGYIDTSNAWSRVFAVRDNRYPERPLPDTRYCYKTDTDVLCYSDPLPGEDHRLVAAQVTAENQTLLTTDINTGNSMMGHISAEYLSPDPYADGYALSRSKTGRYRENGDYYSVTESTSLEPVTVLPPPAPVEVQPLRPIEEKIATQPTPTM